MSGFDKAVNQGREDYIRINRKFIEDFLAEIKSEEYTTVSEVKGSLFTTLDALRMLELQEKGMS